MFDKTEEEERTYIMEYVEMFRQLTGRDFTGWFSPVASAVMTSISSLKPGSPIRPRASSMMTSHARSGVRRGKLLSLPYSMDVNEG